MGYYSYDFGENQNYKKYGSNVFLLILQEVSFIKPICSNFEVIFTKRSSLAYGIISANLKQEIVTKLNIYRKFNFLIEPLFFIFFG